MARPYGAGPQPGRVTPQPGRVTPQPARLRQNPLQPILGLAGLRQNPTGSTIGLAGLRQNPIGLRRNPAGSEPDHSIREERKKRPRKTRNGQIVVPRNTEKEEALVGFRVDGRSMGLPLGNRHGWANVRGRTLWFAPTLPPNVGANLVFAHYARFPLMPKSCGSTALCLRIPSIDPESDKSLVCFYGGSLPVHVGRRLVTGILYKNVFCIYFLGRTNSPW